MLMGLFFFSCEEVVDVPLEESAPRLVIEASLVWNSESMEADQVIRLTTTAPFFQEETPPARNAEVSVIDPSGVEHVFEETEPGVFQGNQLPAYSDGTYEMQVIYENELYQATSSFVTTPPIEEIVQENNVGFSGDETEFRIFYTDPASEENYYLFRSIHDQLSIQIYTDEFTNGNRTFAFFREENIATGKKVGFEIQGISKQFYDYLFLLRSQSGTAGGPFQTQPTLVRGNIINLTSPDNFAFGYFRLSETDFSVYTVK